MVHLERRHSFRYTPAHRMRNLPWWAVALAVCDVGLIALDVLKRSGVLDDPRFLVTVERGYGELFQYFKGTLLAAWLVVVSARRQSRAAFVIAAIVGWIVLDDAFMLHERSGLWLGRSLGIPSGLPLRPEDVGELALLGVAGGISLLALLLTWRARPAERPTVTAGGAGLLVLGFFGVGLDLAHALTPLEHWSRSTLAVVEDGGEMLALSGLAAAMALVHRARR